MTDERPWLSHRQHANLSRPARWVGANVRVLRCRLHVYRFQQEAEAGGRRGGWEGPEEDGGDRIGAGAQGASHHLNPEIPA